MKHVLAMPFIKNQNRKEQILFLSISLVLCTAILGLKWYNSITIIGFALACVFTAHKQRFIKRVIYFFIVPCFLFFLLHLIPYFLNANKASWFETEKKLGFLFLPVLMCIVVPLNKKTFDKIMILVCSVAVLLMLVLLIIAFIKYFQSGDASVFYYHELTAPVNHHAIYLSAYLSLCSFYLYFNMKEKQKPEVFPAFLLGVLVFSILFLSSKSIILIVLLLLLLELRKQFSPFHKKKKSIIMLSVLAVIFFLVSITNNPLRSRFKELYVTDLRVLSTNNYAPDMYFNAVQFRLVAWKFSWQIVSESNAFLFGIGPANAQPALNEKYRKANMFTGESKRFKTGYLEMNAHNQFVQTFLQSGILGLFLLILLLFYFFKEAITQKNKLLLYSLLLITVFFFSESVLEGQYGLILFLFFPFVFFKHEPT